MLLPRSLLLLSSLSAVMSWTLTSRSLLTPVRRVGWRPASLTCGSSRLSPVLLRAVTDDAHSQPMNATHLDQPATVANGARAPNPPSPEFDDSSILAINPDDVRVATLEFNETEVEAQADIIRRLPFVKMFRGSANYIANHRATLAVYHLPGGLLDLPDPQIFRDLMNDIALTWLLGMNVVLVAGCRHQVRKRIREDSRSYGLRITDADTLRIVKEEAGYVRFEVERQLARSLRMQGAGGTSGQGHYDGNVVSGNFYSAQPFGILDGVDYM
jgi:hypothetical protein